MVSMRNPFLSGLLAQIAGNRTCACRCSTMLGLNSYHTAFTNIVSIDIS